MPEADARADRNTILAALRFYQEQGQGEPDNRSAELHELATEGGETISLDAEAIDDLCERVNTSPLAYYGDDRPLRIVITMDGGLIQSVHGLSGPVEALIIDYDVDGADLDDDKITQVPQGGNDAFVRTESGSDLHPAIRAFAVAWFEESANG